MTPRPWSPDPIPPELEAHIRSLKPELDAWVEYVNVPAFVKDDPVQIPRQYNRQADIEIAGLMAALFAWGRRDIGITKARALLGILGDEPAAFAAEASPTDWYRLDDQRHRTFSSGDIVTILAGAGTLLRDHPTLEAALSARITAKGELVTTSGIIGALRDALLGHPLALARTGRHLPAPGATSACKRINLWLRWMVRRDKGGVDLGLWRCLSPADLICPTDVHVLRQAYVLGLIDRQDNSWRVALTLTQRLALLDPADPVRYDYALFGMGVMSKKGRPPGLDLG